MKAVSAESLRPFSDVADTALLTLFCHAAESRRAEPLLHDPWAERIVEQLQPLLAAPGASRLRRVLAAGGIRANLQTYVAVRAARFDRYARTFLRRYPDGCVVNLGCGLDTRFQRVDNGRVRFFDLDLPEVIEVKQDLLEQSDRYRLIAASVTDHSWMDVVAAEPGPYLFLAEGLLMYLPAAEVRALIPAMQARFPGSEFVFETVHSRWLKPGLRWVIALKLGYVGAGPGATFRFGLADSAELETWSPGLRLLDSWSYLDESHPRMGYVRHLAGIDWMRRTQWVLHYRLDPPPR